MFSRVPESFALFRKHLQAFIETDGLKLVKDEKTKNEILVAQLIEMRDKMQTIWIKAMNKDINVDLTFKHAFKKIVNVDNRVAKALVQYIDEMFKKDFKIISETDLGERIDKVISIFRFLEEKDVFEGFYKNSFAKRLLDQRHINEDIERQAESASLAQHYFECILDLDDSLGGADSRRREQLRCLRLPKS